MPKTQREHVFREIGRAQKRLGKMLCDSAIEQQLTHIEVFSEAMCSLQKIANDDVFDCESGDLYDAVVGVLKVACDELNVCHKQQDSCGSSAWAKVIKELAKICIDQVYSEDEETVKRK